MSQTFSPTGEAIAVTLIQALPNTVNLHRTEDKDGYVATQLGLPKNQHKMDQIAARREFKIAVDTDTETLGVDQFSAGDIVTVAGTSKGKGFQGVVKRHGFKGGPASHGHRHVLRAPGSIGGAYPQHVFKGIRMAGRMGGERVTVKNLEVVSVDSKQHVIAIKGAVPGRRQAIVEIMLTKAANEDA